MLVDTGRVAILQLSTGKTAYAMARLAVGTDSTAASAAQTALGSPKLILDAASSVDAANKQVTITAVFQSDGSTYREVGIFGTDGTMFFRQVISPTVYAAGTSFVVSIVVSLT